MDTITAPTALERAGWMAARASFVAGALATMATGGLAGIPLMPFFSYWFFGTPKFWKHLHYFPKLVRYSYICTGKIIKRELGVSSPLAKRPRKAPNLNLVEVVPDWCGTSACGDCSRCCESIGCPLFDAKTGYCHSYDSPFWNYFNCGRYPENQSDINFYGCPKWRVRHA